MFLFSFLGWENYLLKCAWSPTFWPDLKKARNISASSFTIFLDFNNDTCIEVLLCFGRKPDKLICSHHQFSVTSNHWIQTLKAQVYRFLEKGLDWCPLLIHWFSLRSFYLDPANTSNLPMRGVSNWYSFSLNQFLFQQFPTLSLGNRFTQSISILRTR